MKKQGKINRLTIQKIYKRDVCRSLRKYVLTLDQVEENNSTSPELEGRL